MLNNDILRMFRYALDLSDQQVINILALSEQTLDRAALTNLLRKEDEAEFIACSDRLLQGFFDGLILQRRGPPKEGAPLVVKRMDNNEVLKKIKIALKLTSEDIQAMLWAAGLSLSKSEVGALLQRETHKNFKVCGDQVMRNFLKGLALRYRPSA